MKDIPIGTALHETVVTTRNMGTAHVGPAVLATPAMIGLMEMTCLRAAQPYLDEGEQTVGTMVHVWHRAASMIGDPVEVEGRLAQRDRRKLLFEVKVTCKGKLIGEGTHERFVVDSGKFGA
jgi:predicted thioesterase